MKRLHCGTEYMRRLAIASTTSRGRESYLARRNCYVLQPLPQSEKQMRPIPPPYIPARPGTRTLRVTAILETSVRLWSPLRGHPCCSRRPMGLVVTHLPCRAARFAHEIQRRSLCCMWLTNTKRFYAVQTPLRPGTRCWVLHPGFYNTVVGEAKAGVNNKSRSQQKHLVERCKDGQQYILFKKIHRHDTPLLFPNDPHIGSNTMCDGVLWSSGKAEHWVRWWSRYLIDMATAEPLESV